MTKKPIPGEFELIARYFAPLARGYPGALGLADDAALVALAAGQRLVVTVDALAAGVHFLPADPPDLVARKLLRVNLSDLAAMGAEPLVYLLTVALSPEVDANWLEAFAAGLAADQEAFGLTLAGGDTIRTSGPLTLTLTALGTVPEGAELRRSGARAGDDIYVSGQIGDAALGLAVLRGELDGLGGEGAAYLAGRYRLPEPRLALGVRLRGLATAAVDVSDGLVADLEHVCRASGVAAGIEAARVPISAAGRAALASDPALIETVLTGGDDYELLFTASPARADEVAAAASDLDLALTPIGRITDDAEGEVRVVGQDGGTMKLARAGFRHF